MQYSQDVNVAHGKVLSGHRTWRESDKGTRRPGKRDQEGNWALLCVPALSRLELMCLCEWSNEDEGKERFLMNMNTLLSVATMATVASTACAEVDLVLTEFVADGGEFFLQEDGNQLTGVLESASGDFMLYADGADWTWCDDLTVLIANADRSSVLVQIGGYSDLGAMHRFTWPAGANGVNGTVGGGLVVTGSIDVTGYYLFLGNGYLSGGPGYWEGAIALEGSIAAVPVPGTIALVGLGGLVARRRRA